MIFTRLSQKSLHYGKIIATLSSDFSLLKNYTAVYEKTLHLGGFGTYIGCRCQSTEKSIGINTNDPQINFDVNGNLALREGPSLVLANGGASGGVNDNIVLPDITGLSGVKASFYRITGPSAAFSIYTG